MVFLRIVASYCCCWNIESLAICTTIQPSMVSQVRRLFTVFKFPPTLIGQHRTGWLRERSTPHWQHFESRSKITPTAECANRAYSVGCLGSSNTKVPIVRPHTIHNEYPVVSKLEAPRVQTVGSRAALYVHFEQSHLAPLEIHLKLHCPAWDSSGSSTCSSGPQVVSKFTLRP